MVVHENGLDKISEKKNMKIQILEKMTNNIQLISKNKKICCVGKMIPLR